MSSEDYDAGPHGCPKPGCPGRLVEDRLCGPDIDPRDTLYRCSTCLAPFSERCLEEYQAYLKRVRQPA